jgi:hypothetical protein
MGISVKYWGALEKGAVQKTSKTQEYLSHSNEESLLQSLKETKRIIPKILKRLLSVICCFCLWEMSYSTNDDFYISPSDGAICDSLSKIGISAVLGDDLSAYDESERSKYGMFGNFWNYYSVENASRYDKTSSFDRFGNNFADYHSPDGQGFRPAKEIFDLGNYDNMEIGKIPLANSGDRVTILCKKERKGAVSQGSMRSIRLTDNEIFFVPDADVVQVEDGRWFLFLISPGFERCCGACALGIDPSPSALPYVPAEYEKGFTMEDAPVCQLIANDLSLNIHCFWGKSLKFRILECQEQNTYFCERPDAENIMDVYFCGANGCFNKHANAFIPLTVNSENNCFEVQDGYQNLLKRVLYATVCYDGTF